MQVDRYSQTVTFLKVALPLVALGLLSTVFLISRAVTPIATVPFADAEVQQRVANQQVSGPFFSGTSPKGDQIAFIAERLTSPTGEIGSNRAEEVIVQVDLASGEQVMLEADLATVDIADNRSELIGSVEIITSSGYQLWSDRLELALSGVDVTSPGDVRGKLAVGTIEAGGMRLFVPDDSNNAQLLFTNGVKMIYETQNQED